MNAPLTPRFSHVPTIRLTTATPSTTDHASPSVLAPKGNTETRRRLVPKKSKLGLLPPDGTQLASSSPARGDVHRSSTGRTFNVYVDPADDPDIGEIVVIKKKKSRGGLNDLQWGPLGDVTNAPAEGRSNDEKDKWWTLRKGKNSKRALSLKAVDTKTGKPISDDESQATVQKPTSISEFNP